MCGFFSVLGNNLKIDKKNFFESSKLISHRGPDDKQFKFSNNFALSFYRLSLRDLSINGRQPMVSRCGRYMICFNGEIYNANYLKNKYLSNFNLRGTSDTEILIESFCKIKELIFSQLEGMFALLIYDYKENKSIIARDRIGIKPLYYNKSLDNLVVSSEIKPIIKFRKNKNLNYEAFADFFFKGSMDHNKTFFKNIEPLEPGCYATYKNNLLKKKKYWNYSEVNKSTYQPKDIKEILKLAINKHLVSDVKIGSFLSGGTDSSLITTLSSKELGYKMTTFTYDFLNSGTTSESKRAEYISHKINVYNYQNKVSPKFILENFDKVIYGVESPITSIRLFGTYKNYLLSKKKKIKVILEGQGGDEVFGGYKYNYIFYLKDIAKKLSKYNLKKKFLNNNYFKINSEKDLMNFFITLSYQYGSTSDGVPYINCDLFNKDFLNNYLDEKFYKNSRLSSSFLRDSQIRDLTEIKLPRVLKYTDRLSMMNGIETRVPLLDNNLINYGLNLRPEFKFKNGISRWIVKNNFDFKFKFENNKKTIVDPQKKWLKSHLKNFIMDNFNSITFKQSDIFNYKSMIKYYSDYCQDKHETSFNLIQILSAYRFMEIFKKF